MKLRCEGELGHSFLHCPHIYISPFVVVTRRYFKHACLIFAEHAFQKCDETFREHACIKLEIWRIANLIPLCRSRSIVLLLQQRLCA
jgi:hypothetical protein